MSKSTRSVHRATKPIINIPIIPGDKSISHRAILLAALADGKSHIHGLSGGDDVVRTLTAIETLGATIKSESNFVSISGSIIETNSAIRNVTIDCGNSGTGIRLLMGLAAGLEGSFQFDGDDSLRKRPMDRVATPLELMGAHIEGIGDSLTPPIVVRGGNLNGIDYEVPVPSAQVKSAIMFAALFASKPTVVREKSSTRAHSEEMFRASGIDIEINDKTILINPGVPTARDWQIPIDPSQAAFWVVAALLNPESQLVLENVYVGKERIGFVKVLQRMGAKVSVEERDSVLRIGTVTATASPLRATDISPEEVPSLVDEIPILAVAAAHAEGESHFNGLSELRIKESDRLATTQRLIESLGATAQLNGDDLLIRGTDEFHGGFICETEGDHRIAMSAAIAALVASDAIEITRFKESTETSYPEFAAEIEKLQ